MLDTLVMHELALVATLPIGTLLATEAGWDWIVRTGLTPLPCLPSSAGVDRGRHVTFRAR